jgi:magnesium chelatase subunit H
VADAETDGILRALDGRFIAPVMGADLLRTPEVLPAGRNVYGFDPYRVPSASAMREGRAQAERLLARHAQEHGAMPESVALVLWGTDNMKSEGSAIAQALALLGAEPRFDGLGRLCGARLVPLPTLGRPRIDVVMTLSGVFRDLFPLQIRLLAEAALLAAQADEPLDDNAVRRHALATQAAEGCDLATAALRVFGNADGAYGANVNLLVDAGTWSDDAELGEAFARRKSFAYGLQGVATARPALFARALATAELSYQMIDSVELGATDVDQYVDSLGGLSRAMRAARGRETPVYMGDATGTEGKVRTLDEQVAFESRTRLLNPRWYEGMLRSGHEGVRAVSTRVTTTLGWSATTGAVPAWVYRDVTTTFVTDDAMRERLAALNPHAALQMTARLLEASDRGYWQPDDATLDALRAANADLEDRIEGVFA